VGDSSGGLLLAEALDALGGRHVGGGLCGGCRKGRSGRSARKRSLSGSSEGGSAVGFAKFWQVRVARLASLPRFSRARFPVLASVCRLPSTILYSFNHITIMPVYALGSNGSCQLGVGHDDDLSAPSLVAIANLDASIKSIKAGGNHTLILTKSGTVYATGENADGRCAISTEVTSISSFTPSTLHEMDFIAATWDASIYASAHAVYVCGSGVKGELGLGQSVVKADSPQQIPDFPPTGTQIIDLAACMGHVVVVLSDGHVYGWGNGQHGQLGSSLGIVWTPRRLDDISFPVFRAVCGKDFTCVFGDSADGKLQLLGLAKRDRFNIKSNTPQTLPNWIDVQATWGGIYVLLSDNSLVAWGRNDHGQLPPADMPIIAMAAGSEHMLVLTTSGKVLAWGWGEHGNCGLPTDEQRDVKGRWNELDAGKNVQHIGAGCATSWIITT
jgi:protein ATS1